MRHCGGAGPRGPELEAEVDAEPGVSITYDHDRRLVVAEATGMQLRVSVRGFRP